jgi:predicted DNA-binding transcriptional regulator AlpA
MESDILVDAATVAEKLGQAKSSIYRLAKANVIPSYAAGPKLKGLRFDLAEVRAALRRQPQKQAGCQ